MTTVDEMMAADLQGFLLKDVVVYNGTSVKAEIQRGSGDEYKGYDDFDVKAIIRVTAKDVPVVVTGDVILIGSTTWEVIGAQLSKCGLLWEINANRRTS